MEASAPDITARTIKDMVELYKQYVRRPNDTKPLSQLIVAIQRTIHFLKGSWDYESDSPILSCFRGLTKACWLLSEGKPKDGADAYKSFVLENYKLWSHMTYGGANEYRSNCHDITDTEDDWKTITKDGTERQIVCQAAMEVTSGMYGAGKRETVASEALWTGRLVPPS